MHVSCILYRSIIPWMIIAALSINHRFRAHRAMPTATRNVLVARGTAGGARAGGRVSNARPTDVPRVVCETQCSRHLIAVLSESRASRGATAVTSRDARRFRRDATRLVRRRLPPPLRCHALAVSVSLSLSSSSSPDLTSRRIYVAGARRRDAVRGDPLIGRSPPPRRPRTPVPLPRAREKDRFPAPPRLYDHYARADPRAPVAVSLHHERSRDER